tara:strand:- start:1268 stop:1954 length:687 start_codon:yes stop_codon:yes gene_type:complete
MKYLRSKIAVLAISFVSFLGIQTANASPLEGLSIGLSYNQAVFMGTGKETSTSGAGTKRNIDAEETGVFEDNIGSAFVEYKVGLVSIGVEYHLEDLTTPTNTNKQRASVEAGALKTNTVKATFEDHTTIYANVNFTPNSYFKIGYLMTDVATEESLGTGGAYPNVDTDGYTLGLGYQYTADNGVFARVEVTGSQYDDVSATNSNESDKKVEVTSMYGASAALKIGKSF